MQNQIKGQTCSASYMIWSLQYDLYERFTGSQCSKAIYFKSLNSAKDLQKKKKLQQQNKRNSSEDGYRRRKLVVLQDFPVTTRGVYRAEMVYRLLHRRFLLFPVVRGFLKHHVALQRARIDGRWRWWRRRRRVRTQPCCYLSNAFISFQAITNTIAKLFPCCRMTRLCYHGSLRAWNGWKREFPPQATGARACARLEMICKWAPALYRPKRARARGVGGSVHAFYIVLSSALMIQHPEPCCYRNDSPEPL